MYIANLNYPIFFIVLQNVTIVTQLYIKYPTLSSYIQYTHLWQYILYFNCLIAVIVTKCRLYYWPALYIQYIGYIWTYLTLSAYIQYTYIGRYYIAKQLDFFSFHHKMFLSPSTLWKVGYIKMSKFIHIHKIYTTVPSTILAPLVNMTKGSCENKSALLILFIFH